VRWRWIEQSMIVSPLLATALICMLDVLTRDASPGGQIAFSAPVLYAASQLRITGAVIVLVTTIGAELVTVLLLEPVDRALGEGPPLAHYEARIAAAELASALGAADAQDLAATALAQAREGGYLQGIDRLQILAGAG